MARVTATNIRRIESTKRYDGQLGIFASGVDNLYPDRMEQAINDSVTAKRCAKLRAKYILGKGFGDDNKLIVNNKNETLFDFAKSISNDIARQNGFYVHVNIGLGADLNPYIDSFSHIPYTHGRIGKKDDDEYNGKIKLHSNWSEASKSTVKEFDVFNLNKNVVSEQIKAYGGISQHKGQVLYVNLDSGYIYAISRMDNVLDSGKSQVAISRLARRSLEQGRFGTTVIVTDEMIDHDLDKEVDAEEIFEQKKELQSFQDNLRQSQGYEEPQSIIHVQINADGKEDITKAIHSMSIDSNINDKMFEATRIASKEDIAEAYGTPMGLLRPQAGMFGNSGEAYNQMKLFLQEDTEEERIVLTETINMLLSNLKEPVSVTQEKLIPDAD